MIEIIKPVFALTVAAAISAAGIEWLSLEQSKNSPPTDCLDQSVSASVDADALAQSELANGTYTRLTKKNELKGYAVTLCATHLADSAILVFIFDADKRPLGKIYVPSNTSVPARFRGLNTVFTTGGNINDMKRLSHSTPMCVAVDSNGIDAALFQRARTILAGVHHAS